MPATAQTRAIGSGITCVRQVGCHVGIGADSDTDSVPDDQISGAVGCDTLSRLEEAPADLLAGSAGNEQCCGGERDDDLRSVKGDDWLAGDAGQPRRHTDFPLVADTIRRDDTVLVGLARGGLAAAAFAPDCRCRCR